ncbi:CIR protein, partial [Plasmodium chabaudi chabaudi]
MDPQKMCKLFREADSYFNGKDVDTTKINKYSTIKSYCRDDGGCKTNEERINALAEYIIMDFKRSIEKNEYNDYDEYLLMWISDKLFKIHKEAKNIREGYMDDTTLKQAYEEYLEKHIGILDYWVLLDMIKGLKEAYLKYMSEFYKLLNNICITIKEYNDKGAKSRKLSKYSKNCLNQYRILYMNIPKCKSYLHLLNKLKGLYDDFRSSAINKNGSNNNLETILQKLTLGNGTELEAARKFKTYDFSGSQCKLPPKKNTISNKADPSGLPPSSKEVPPPQPLSQLKDSHDKTSSEEPGASSDEKCNQVSIGDGVNGKSVGTDIEKGCSEGGSEDIDKGPLNTDGEQDAINIVPEASSLEILNAAAYLVNATISFETIKKRITEVTDTIKDLYSTALTNLEDTYNKYSNSLKEIINSINTDSNEVYPPSESGGGGDDPSPPQKDSSQTPSDTSQNSQSPQLPSSTEENKTDHSSQDSSEKESSDQTDQEGSEKTVEVPVIISEHPGNEVKGNGTIGVGDIYIFKEYKKIGIPIIVIIISITLAIMYK